MYTLILLVAIILIAFFILAYAKFYKKYPFLKKIFTAGVAVSTIAAGVGFLIPTGDEPIVPEPYIYQRATIKGGISRWVINRSFAKNFLKDSFDWRLQASVDAVTWYNADSLLDVGLVWSNVSDSYKVTLTLDTNDAPRDLYYRFDLAVNKGLKKYAEVNGYEWTLTLPTGTERDYQVLFNWSDIKSLVDTGKVTVSRGVTDNFFWFRVKTVNRIAVDKIFVLDPTYGVIADAVVDSWEYDKQEGKYPDMIRLGTSEYYAIVSTGDTGAENDGYIRTIRVWDSNGTIQQSLIDSYEFETITLHAGASIIHIDNDIYMVAFGDFADNSRFITIKIWESNGTIADSVTDTMTVVNNMGNPRQTDIIRLSSTVFVCLFKDGSSGVLNIVTVEVDSAGDITNGFLDSEALIQAYTNQYDICKVDDDTIAVVLCDADSDGKMYVYNVSGVTGLITDDYADFWEFDTARGSAPTISKVSGTTYMVAYEDTNADLYVKTCTIGDDGSITKSWIDTQAIDTTNGDYSTFFNVSLNGTTSNQWIKGISFSGEGNDGYVSTFDVTNAGVIGSEIDTLEIVPANTVTWYMPVSFVANDYYLVINQDSDSDGWAKTINITTYVEEEIPSNTAPVITDTYPHNYDTNINVMPICNVTVNDPDGDTMDIIWEEFQTPIWVEVQRNNSVNNGTYSWVFVNASKYNSSYSFRVTANDSTLTDEAQIYFTTISSYNRTIRTNGIDYFTWLGDNTTASVVKLNITGFDEAEEYLAIFNNTGEWVKYYGDASGTNWDIHTFDIVRSYMNDSVGNITFNMTANPNINYNGDRTVGLIKIGNGYNYTGYTNSSNTNLSNLNTTLTLATGYFVSRWNRTGFDWDVWISGFGTMSGIDYIVSRWDVINTKIEANKTWNI